MTERERTSVPPPQVLEQGVQLLQPPTSQCCGHGVLLQTSVSTLVEASGHAKPPALAATLLRERILLPPSAPHETVQSVKELQEPILQSTGHAFTLQD